MTDAEYQYSFHVVAFLDLLGQRQLFEDLPGVPKSPEDQARLKNVIGHTVIYIRRFRAYFKELFDAFHAPRPIPAAIPPEFHGEYRLLQRTEVHLQSVSDSVIAWTPAHVFNEQELAKTMSSTWGMLCASAGVMLISLATKHPLRGAIEFDGGITIEPGGNEIYGRALNKAYDSEQDDAEFPRILAGNTLVDFLNSVMADPPGSRFIGLAKGMAARSLRLLVRDSDGRYIIDYLGQGARDFYSTTGPLDDFYKNVVQPAYIFAKESKEQYKDNTVLFAKYEALVRYFDQHIPDWKKALEGKNSK